MEPVDFLMESDLPVFWKQKDLYVNSMIGWNNIEAGYPILTGRPFIKIPVVVTDNLSCRAVPEIGEFCIKPVHKEQAVNTVDTFL